MKYVVDFKHRVVVWWNRKGVRFVEKIYAFTDESGSFGWELDNENTSTHFIITAIIVRESDVDAVRTVSKGIEMYKNEENAVLIITHNTRILENLKVDYVHILVDGKIVKTGDASLAQEIEENGYSQYK